MPENPERGIDDCLDDIKNAVFGEQVRDAFIEAIQLCYNDILTYVVEHVVSGKSAYEIACDYEHYESEEDWLASLKGDPGPPGPQGPQGDAGSGGEIIVDGDLDGNSGHAVANSAVVAGLNQKMNAKPFNRDLARKILVISGSGGLTTFGSKEFGSNNFESTPTSSKIPSELSVSNYTYSKNESDTKYATKTELNSKANSSDVYNKTASDGRYVQNTNVDSEISSTSTNPVQNKAVYDAIQNIEISVELPIDDNLDPESENAVQNKVITEYLTGTLYPDIQQALMIAAQKTSRTNVFDIIDEVLSGPGTDRPCLTVKEYESNYWLTYYDSEDENPHYLYNLSSILQTIPDLQNYYNKTEIDSKLLEIGGRNVVNNVSEMTDTARLYVLAETGHIWRYASTTIDPPNELSIQSDKYNKRISGVDINGTTSSGTGTFIADPIAVDLTVDSCTVTFKNFAAAMASYTSTTSYKQSKIVALDANQTPITNCGLMMSRRSNNDEWQITVSGDDMTGDLIAFADRLVTKGTISNKSQIKYVVFSLTISESSISSSDIANMGIYISTHGGTTNTWIDTGITYGGGNEEALESLDIRMTTAENNIIALSDNDAIIPSYWQSEVDDTVEKIKALQDEYGHDLLCFGWCSDMHIHPNGTEYEQYLGAVAARVMNECDIPLFLMTGDMLTADTAVTALTAPTAYKKAWEYLSPIGKERIMAVKGNHDAWFGNDGNGNYYVYGLPPSKVHQLIFSPQEKDISRVFGEDGSYFYVDNKPQKTRFICLNSQWADYTEDANGRALYSTQKGAGFGQTQLNWFINEALNVEPNYSVIITFHVPPTNGHGSDGDPDYMPSFKNAFREYDIIRGIISAYINKTTYVGVYTHNSTIIPYKQEGTWADVTVNCDFSNYNGTLLALFCGHAHRDRILVNDLSTIPIVCITSAINTPYDGGGSSSRVLGTSSETAMDFVCINRSSGDINLIRCGCGNDRSTN